MSEETKAISIKALQEIESVHDGLLKVLLETDDPEVEAAIEPAVEILGRIIEENFLTDKGDVNGNFQ